MNFNRPLRHLRVAGSGRSPFSSVLRCAAGLTCGLLLLPAGAALAASGDSTAAAPVSQAGAPSAFNPDAPVTSSDQFAPDGVMPRHIPPNLFGRIETVAPGQTSFSLLATAAAADGPIKINLPSYAAFYQISRINAGTLRRGDSVLVQGQSANDRIFNAVRVTRLAKTIPLGPGIGLAESPTPGADTTASPAAATPAVATPAVATPAQSAGAPAQSAPAGTVPPNKAGAQAAKRLQRSINRGVLPGQVVSTQPLVVELYNGELWTVNMDPGAPVLDQTPAASTILGGGSVVKVTGSEIAPRAFRASEVDVLGPGLTLRDLAGRPGQNAGRRGRRVNVFRRPRLFPRQPGVG